MEIDSICQKISEILRKIGKIDKDDQNFNFDVDLFDYGYLDSFGVVELLLEIKQSYSFDLSHEDFYQDLRTIRLISYNILKKYDKNEK